MNDSVFFDTTTILYAVGEEGRQAEAAAALLGQRGTISVQVLNEFASVTRRKLGWSWAEIAEGVDQLQNLCRRVLPLTRETHAKGRMLAERYGCNIYDSLILASALEARCAVVYSEDMQDGQQIESLRIRNPFV